MTSSTKPEVHTVSQRRQSKTEPRPQATRTKIGEVWGWYSSYASRQTNRHANKTDVIITVLRTLPGSKNIECSLFDHCTGCQLKQPPACPHCLFTNEPINYTSSFNNSQYHYVYAYNAHTVRLLYVHAV